MKRYFVSYRYRQGMSGSQHFSEQYGHWTIERNAPVVTDDDLDSMAYEIEEAVKRIRKPLVIVDFSVLNWRRFEEPE